jgi:hypothetical protein
LQWDPNTFTEYKSLADLVANATSLDNQLRRNQGLEKKVSIQKSPEIVPKREGSSKKGSSYGKTQKFNKFRPASKSPYTPAAGARRVGPKTYLSAEER